LSLNFKAIFTPFFSSAMGNLSYGFEYDYFLDAEQMINNFPVDVKKQAIEFLRQEAAGLAVFSRSEPFRLKRKAIQELLNRIS